MKNSRFLTLITYSLTPSTSNLVKVEARYFIKRFAWRSNEIRGWRGCFVTNYMIGQQIDKQPIRNTVSATHPGIKNGLYGTSF